MGTPSFGDIFCGEHVTIFPVRFRRFLPCVFRRFPKYLVSQSNNVISVWTLFVFTDFLTFLRLVVTPSTPFSLAHAHSVIVGPLIMANNDTMTQEDAAIWQAAMADLDRWYAQTEVPFLDDEETLADLRNLRVHFIDSRGDWHKYRDYFTRVTRQYGHVFFDVEDKFKCPGKPLIVHLGTPDGEVFVFHMSRFHFPKYLRYPRAKDMLPQEVLGCLSDLSITKVGSAIQGDFNRLKVKAGPFLDTQRLTLRLKNMGLFDLVSFPINNKSGVGAMARLMGREDFKPFERPAFVKAYEYDPPDSRWPTDARSYLLYRFKAENPDPEGPPGQLDPIHLNYLLCENLTLASFVFFVTKKIMQRCPGMFRGLKVRECIRLVLRPDIGLTLKDRMDCWEAYRPFVGRDYVFPEPMPVAHVVVQGVGGKKKKKKVKKQSDRDFYHNMGITHDFSGDEDYVMDFGDGFSSGDNEDDEIRVNQVIPAEPLGPSSSKVVETLPDLPPTSKKFKPLSGKRWRQQKPSLPGCDACGVVGQHKDKCKAKDSICAYCQVLGHDVFVCPTLHSYCSACWVRGHHHRGLLRPGMPTNLKRCDGDLDKYFKYFESFADEGVYTIRRRTHWRNAFDDVGFGFFVLPKAACRFQRDLDFSYWDLLEMVDAKGVKFAWKFVREYNQDAQEGYTDRQKVKVKDISHADTLKRRRRRLKGKEIKKLAAGRSIVKRVNF